MLGADRDSRMKTVGFPHIVCVQVIAPILLLSSCGGGGNSTQGALAEDDCTSSTNLSTQLEFEVDINGNISAVPVANNSVSGCGSNAEAGDFIDTEFITTRFRASDDFDVWNCIGSDGSNLQYALTSFDDFVSDRSFRRYAFEIDPSAQDLTAAQQLYVYRELRSPNADVITFWEGAELDVTGDIQSEWTDIRVTSEDDISFTSSSDGAMQCHRTISVIDLAADRFDFPCEFRPGACCLCDP